MDSSTGALMAANLPVGVCCPHRNITPTPMQHPSYREDDEGRWIYYHGYVQVGSTWKFSTLEWCGRPEPWRAQYYTRRCGECNKKFSNPWVPVCEDCWPDSTSYPSWDYVIQLDRRYKGENNGQ